MVVVSGANKWLIQECKSLVPLPQAEKTLNVIYISEGPTPTVQVKDRLNLRPYPGTFFLLTNAVSFFLS